MTDLKDIKPEVLTVNIEGKDYKIEYDYNSYAVLEELSGKSKNEIKELLAQDKLTTKQEIDLIYCALIKHNPDFSKEKISKITDIYSIGHNVVMAFIKPLTPPEIFDTLNFEDKGEKEEKKTAMTGQKSIT